MNLVKRRKSPFWFTKFKVGGRSFTRATRETDKRKAARVAEEIRREVRSLYERRGADSTLSAARIAEVERVESDSGERQATRVERSLWHFEQWCEATLGRIPLVRQITSELVENYQRARLRERAKQTVDHEVHAICRMLRRSGHLIEKPRAKPGKRTEVRPLTDEELRRFFEVCPEPLATACLLMVTSGARPAEVFPSERSGHVAVLKEELDEEQGTIRIRTAKLLRGQPIRFRTAALPEHVAQRLVEIGKTHDLPTIFPPMWPLYRHMDYVLKSAGILKINLLGQKVTAHSFRHTYATKLAQVTANAFVVRAALGHSTLYMTDKYVRPEAAPVIDLGLDRLKKVTPQGGNKGGNAASEAKAGTM